MRIHAALYGVNQLQFIGDAVKDKDLAELVNLLRKTGIREPKPKKVSSNTKLELLAGENWAGSLEVSEQNGDSGIGCYISFAMAPYASSLMTPKFIFARIQHDPAIDLLLSSHPFPSIITSEAADIETFRQRFPEHAKTYNLRAQTLEEAAYATAAGRAAIESF